MAHGQVNGFASLLVQFPQVRQAQATDIELTDGGLSDGKACDSKVVGAFAITIQESRGNQVGEKAMNCAHRKASQGGHLLGGEASRGFAEKMKKAQSALQSGNVVIPLGTNVHKTVKNESAGLSDEI
jgi:hypothetical protein